MKKEQNIPNNKEEQKKESFFSRFFKKIGKTYDYWSKGVWQDTRNTFKVRVIKVINLSIQSFFDRDLQTKSMSLTYSTVLAIVPAFALLFAIGRGFGFQSLLEDQLFMNFPAQKNFITFALKFVDSYLSEASQGVFVGIGIIFLLYTLISLLSDIETSFNQIWDVKHDRSIYQKVTDYIAICLMVPVLMICSSGVSIFMSSSLQSNAHFAFLTPLVNVGLEASPFILAWIAFSISFFLIPNTKVEFKYAATAGAICAVMFQILQMLFLSGQIYVSKYNAIYGSFSFLPLLLIWLQFSWLILLFGCVLTYSMQNVFAFNFLDNKGTVSENYNRKVTIILIVAIVKRFINGRTPHTRSELSFLYDVPIRMVSRLCDKLHTAGFVNYVVLSEEKIGVSPAFEPDKLTVGQLFEKLDKTGSQNFIPRFDNIYGTLLKEIDEWLDKSYASMDDILIRDIQLPVKEEENLENTPDIAVEETGSN